MKADYKVKIMTMSSMLETEVVAESYREADRKARACLSQIHPELEMNQCLTVSVRKISVRSKDSK